ncbi:MAG: dihydrofolate reductase [Verrucomicrobiaceae bacterium]|nr:MAG: dihydrofolate reductase [Verrucomicrobiaceae bacterium]
MSLNRVIGRANKIPWHLPEDFRWFKQCTTGQVILMGRKTFESLGKPLPNRTNVVVSRSAEFPGVEIVRDLKAFDPKAYGDREVWVIGGAEIYSQLLPKCSDLYLTVVQREVEGDAYFPEFEPMFEFVKVELTQPEFEVRHYRRASVQ